MTKDHVNPEAPWPEVEHLRQATEEAGNCLAARLPVYPKFCTGSRSAPAVLGKWQDAAVAPAVFRAMDAEGLVRREETSSAAASGPGWTAGSVMDIPAASDSDARFMPGGAAYVWQDWRHVPNVSSQVRRALSKVLPSPMARDCRPRVAHAVEQAGPALGKQDIEALLRARGRDLAAVCLAADELRRRCCGGKVSYAVVVRYIAVSVSDCMHAPMCFSLGRPMGMISLVALDFCPPPLSGSPLSSPYPLHRCPSFAPPFIAGWRHLLACSHSVTSTTPTCATSSVLSAPSPRASTTSEGSPTTSGWRRSRGGRARHGSAVPPKSACRAGSIQTSPGEPTSTSCEVSKTSSPRCTCTHFRPSKFGTGPQRSSCRFRPSCGSSRRPGLARFRAQLQKCSMTKSALSSVRTR